MQEPKPQTARPARRGGQSTEAAWPEQIYYYDCVLRGAIDVWDIAAGSFQFRDLSSGGVVHCRYGEALYDKVYQAVRSLRSVSTVYGDILWDRATNSIITLYVQDIGGVTPVPEAEFAGLFRVPVGTA
jgi:hypothetical protein